MQQAKAELLTLVPLFLISIYQKVPFDVQNPPAITQTHIAALLEAKTALLSQKSIPQTSLFISNSRFSRKLKTALSTQNPRQATKALFTISTPPQGQKIIKIPTYKQKSP